MDGLPRSDWSFRIFPLPDGYAACVARGPPSACSTSGREAGIITDPDMTGLELAEGFDLPQIMFESVRLRDIIPAEAWKELVALGS